jgi:threonine synthase
MWRGFEDMRAFGWTDRSPRMIAAEIYGSLSAALRTGDDKLPDMPQTHETVAKSTTATQSTFQALDTIRRSGGKAIVVGNADIMRWQQQLAREEGLYVEPTSAGGIAAIAQLRDQGEIAVDEKGVVLLTASGLKDPEATSALQGDLVAISDDIEGAFTALRTMKLIPG